MSPDVDDGGETTALEVQRAAVLTARLDHQVPDEPGRRPVRRGHLTEHPTYDSEVRRASSSSSRTEVQTSSPHTGVASTRAAR